jgi:hypothetical protein
VVKQNGGLWVFGDNNYGQLGTGDHNSIYDKLTSKDSYQNWIKVAAGSRHSLAINNIGVLYGWGSGQDYQFGFAQNDFDKPTLIWGGNWIDISAKGNLSGAIAGDYVFQELTTQTPTPTTTNTLTPSISPPPPSQSATPPITPTISLSPSYTSTNSPTPTPTKPVYLVQVVNSCCEPTPTISKTPPQTPTITSTPTPTPTREVYDFTTITFVV